MIEKIKQEVMITTDLDDCGYDNVLFILKESTSDSMEKLDKETAIVKKKPIEIIVID
jgi:hypothetical protein